MNPRPALVVTAFLLVAVALAGSVASTSSSYNGVTTNPTSNFTAAASFGCTPPTVNPVWMTGVEHGVATSAASSGLWNVSWAGSPATTVTADTAVTRNGAYALKIAKTATSQTGGVGRGVGGTVTVWRFAFRLNALPTGNVSEWASAYGTGGNGNLLIGYDNASQKLSLGFSGGTQRLSASTLSAGTWYVLETRINYGVNPHTADWQLNGVAQTQATKAVNAESASEIGFGPSVAGANITFWVDDVVVSQTSSDYPIGDGKVLGLSPDAMGTSTDPSARLSTEAGAWGSTTWNKLDDAPMTSTADYVRQTVVDSGAYLETTFANTSETCINAVMGELAYHASSTGGNTAKTSLFEGATERVVYSGSMATTTLSYRSAMIAPATGTWDQSKLNGLKARIGYTSALTGQPYWDAMLVEYNVDL